MTARSFCTVTASTKRSTDGDTPAAYLASLLITPLWPLSPETRNTMALNSPREAKECYHVPVAGGALPDVVEGDRLVVAGTEYPVLYAAEWAGIDADDIPCLHIVVQEIKRA